MENQLNKIMDHTLWGVGDRFLHNYTQSSAGNRMCDQDQQTYFGNGGFYHQNAYPILQNQNLYLDTHQTSNQAQFGHGGFFYQNGYQTLQNQNVFLNSQEAHQSYDRNQFGQYGMHFAGHQFVSQEINGYGFTSYRYPLPDECQHRMQNSDSFPGHWTNENQPLRAIENQNMVSSGCNSSSIEYQLLSNHSEPSEFEGETHQEDRRSLVNFLDYLPMPADHDMSAKDDGVNDSDVILNICSEVNVDEHDPNVPTGNSTIELDENRRDENGRDESEQNVATEPLIIQPTYKIGCDNSDMYVDTSDCKSRKKLCCPYCKKLYSKLARHLEVKHKNEPDVQRFLSFPKGSKQRRLIQASLRNAGMGDWNKSAKLNEKKMITCRRPNPKFGNAGIRFKMCPYCKGGYTKLGLRLHIKKCTQKPIGHVEKTKGQRVITALATSVEARYLQSTSPALENVYKKFRDDELVRSLKFDWLITVYGNKLAAKNTKLKSPDMIKGRLRVIARFLRELKRIEPEVTDLATMYHPKYFDRVVEAIQALGRFNADTNEYGAPSTASSCVTAIKQIGVMLTSEYIKKNDPAKQHMTKNFLIVMETDIHYLINKVVNENQSKMKRRKVIILPSLDDIKLLNQYIQSESNDCYNELSKSWDDKKWLYLSKLTMISILVFNRKRVGDTENILLEEFMCREAMNEKTNQQLFASLPNEAKEIAVRYSRMKVRGKKNRTVPVLLNKSMEDSLNLLIAHRSDAGIAAKNEYLFALPPSAIEEIKVINAGIALKRFAERSGAKNPSSINGTNLRKQLATMCVSMKLDDADVADVADFMGHAELVHRNNYRQNTIDRQVVKMSQWLEAALGNVASIDTERSINTENRQKAIELLQKLEAALCEEVEEVGDRFDHSSAESTINVPMEPVASRKREPTKRKTGASAVQNCTQSSHVPMERVASRKTEPTKRKTGASAVQNCTQSSDEPMERVASRKTEPIKRKTRVSAVQNSTQSSDVPMERVASRKTEPTKRKTGASAVQNSTQSSDEPMERVASRKTEPIKRKTRASAVQNSTQSSDVPMKPVASRKGANKT